MKKIFYLAVPILAAGLVAVPATVAANANSVTTRSVSSVSFEETYDYGTELTVPTLEKEGVTFNSSVIFPNNEAYNTKKVILNQVGVYQVRYTALLNGQYVHEDYSFKVLNRYYHLSGNKSFAKYEQNESTFDRAGLHVSLAQGEEISFTKPINLNELDPKASFFRAFVTPAAVGSLDFGSLFVTLTDVEDPTQVLKIEMRASNEGIKHPYTYISAAGPDQAMCGVQVHNGQTIIHIQDGFGTPVNHSFYAAYDNPSDKGKKDLNLNYRVSENTLFTNSGQTLVCKFDNSKHFSNLWPGFPSGKVLISFSASGYSNDYASFVLTDIAGMDLTSDVYEDFTAPEITVHTEYEVLPQAIVGYKYPVFIATAYDEVSKYCNVTSSAYYVKDGHDYALSIKDHYFNVNKPGTYKIVYESQDAVGNLAHVEKVITTKDGQSPIVVSPKTVISESWLKGVPYEFPQFKVSGGSGNYSDQFVVKFNGKVVDFEDGKFIPRQVGNYEVSYVVSDITTQTQTYSYVLSVEYNDGVVFYEKPSLPKYFISGYKYILPELHGVDYGNAGKTVVADVDITYNGETQTIKSGESFTPSVHSHMDEITITYKAKDAKITQAVKTVLPVNDRVFAIEKYLIGDTFNWTSKEDRSVISSKVNGNASFEFANPVAAEGVSVNFAPIASKSNYAALELTLVDKYNTDQRVTLRLHNVSGLMTFEANGKKIKTDSSFDSASIYRLSYQNGTAYFGKLGVEITKYDNGEPFYGFDSQFVYINMGMAGATTSSAFELQKIDNQSIATTTYDAMEPRITVLDRYGGYQAIGTSSKTARIIVSDVLDPSCEYSVSIRTPEKKYAKDINGYEVKNANADVRYEFLLDEYGRYSVSYSANDSIGNQATFAYAVGVLDDVAPEIKLTSDYTTSCSVGENIVVPTVSVSDNYDKPEDIAVYIVIYSPTGAMHVIPNNCNALKAAVKGTYKVVITAMDTSGNMTKVSYNVTVA